MQKQQQQPQMMDGGGQAIQMPMPQNMLESEMIGAIKIKDGLFIGDELASTVSDKTPLHCIASDHLRGVCSLFLNSSLPVSVR